MALIQDIVADEDWYDEHSEIGITEAQKIRKTYEVGDRIITPLKTKDFGRIAAQTAKHVIRQGIRDSERDQMMQEFKEAFTTAQPSKEVGIHPQNYSEGGEEVLEQKKALAAEYGLDIELSLIHI